MANDIAYTTYTNDQGKLNNNIHCANCNYNLHTISIDSHCPECGFSTAQSCDAITSPLLNSTIAKRFTTGLWLYVAILSCSILRSIPFTLLLTYNTIQTWITGNSNVTIPSILSAFSNITYWFTIATYILTPITVFIITPKIYHASVRYNRYRIAYRALAILTVLCLASQQILSNYAMKWLLTPNANANFMGISYTTLYLIAAFTISTPYIFFDLAKAYWCRFIAAATKSPSLRRYYKIVIALAWTQLVIYVVSIASAFIPIANISLYRFIPDQLVTQIRLYTSLAFSILLLVVCYKTIKAIRQFCSNHASV